MPTFRKYKAKNVKISGIDYKLWVADTFKKRSIGLSAIKSLPKNQGMIFVYDQDVSNDFTMKNTAISLHIIFIDKDFKIIDHFDCEPFHKSPINPQRPYRYVIEINTR